MAVATRTSETEQVRVEHAPRPEHRGHFAAAAYTRYRRQLRSGAENMADAVRDGARDARRAARRAEWAAEDARDELRARVRHAPLTTVGVAFASGIAAALTTVAGFALARRFRG